MLPRPFMLAALLGATIGVPYVASKTNANLGDGNKGLGWITSAFQSSDSKNPSPYTSASSSISPLERIPVYPLSEVLRWEVNREWVYARWPRKSTGLSDPQRFGVRVPLVTGMRPGDLAGSLTYYFGRDGRLEHISFRGRTGDTGQILRLATTRFGLQPAAAAPGEQLFRLGRGDQLKSQLRTRTESVLWSNTPHRSFLVELELERPDTAHFFEDPSMRLPTSIAGVPVQSGQIQRAKPVPFGPIGAFAKTVDGRSVAREVARPVAEIEPRTASQSNVSAQVEKVAEPAPKVEFKAGVRRRMRWGN